MSHTHILAQRYAPIVQQGSGAPIYKGVLFQKGYGPVYTGVHFQRGYGCCGVQPRSFQRGKGWPLVARIFSKLGPALMRGINTLLPHAKTIGKEAVRAASTTALNTGVQFLGDVIDGENVLESAKERLREGGREMVNNVKTQAVEQGMNLAKGLKRKLDDKLQNHNQSGGGGGGGRVNKRRRRGSGNQKGGLVGLSTLGALGALAAKRKIVDTDFIPSSALRAVGRAVGRVFKRSRLPYNTVFDD
jgi:hypothetical protein